MSVKEFARRDGADAVEGGEVVAAKEEGEVDELKNEGGERGGRKSERERREGKERE